jgi:hypothetical protein
MLWLWLALWATGFIAVSHRLLRPIFCRARGCLIGLLFLTILAPLCLLLAPQVHAQGKPQDPVVFASPLASAIAAPASPRARGRVFFAQLPVRLPEPLPLDAQVLLSGSADGNQPLSADDLLRIQFLGPKKQSFTFEHNFASSDGQTIRPFGPINLTSVLPRGPLQVIVELIDVRPPRYSLATVYLVVRSSALQQSISTDQRPTTTGQAELSHRKARRQPSSQADRYPSPLGTEDVVIKGLFALGGLSIAVWIGNMARRRARKLLEEQMLNDVSDLL